MIPVPAWLNAIFIITGTVTMLVWVVKKIRKAISEGDE